MSERELVRIAGSVALAVVIWSICNGAAVLSRQKGRWATIAAAIVLLAMLGFGIARIIARNL